MARFPAIYHIRNNGGTYEAWQDEEASATYSGTALVANVLDAIDTANASGRFAVFFGPGDFDMAADNWTIASKSDILIAGSGIGVTHVFNSSGAGDSEPFSMTAVDRMTIRDMDITAGGAANSTSDAIDFDNGDFNLVERVRILASRGSGIVFDGKDGGAQAIGNTIRDCVVTGTQNTSAGHGVKLLAADYTVIDGLYVHDTAGDGIQVAKSSSGSGRPNTPSNHTVIKNLRAVNCGRNGVRVLSSNYTKIVAPLILNSGDDVTADGFRIETADSIQADYNQVIGGVIGDDQTGVETQRYGANVQPQTPANSIGTRIEGVTFFGNTTAPVNDAGQQTWVRDCHGAPDNTAATITTTATLAFDDPRKVIVGDTSGGAFTITLADNAAAAGTSIVFIRDGATNALTVSRAGTDTIDGATTKSLDTDGATLGIVSVGGGDWRVISTTGTVS